MDERHLIRVDDEVYAELSGVRLVLVDDDVYGHLHETAAELHYGSDLNMALRWLLELAPPEDPQQGA